MGGTRYGILGTDAPPTQIASAGDIDVLGDGNAPGSLGIDEPDAPNLGAPPAIPLDTTGRKIAKVTKDWDTRRIPARRLQSSSRAPRSKPPATR